MEAAIASRRLARLRAALDKATSALLVEMNPEGFWTGHLSSSALSTATAIVALREVDRARSATEHSGVIAAGLSWLATHQNADGGWGDTVVSKSNISTTALCWAAIRAAADSSRYRGIEQRAAAWLQKAGDKPLPDLIAARYGRDRTFSVPILMHLAICGEVSWTEVPSLPFELAALPHQLFGALRLPVVSYALPALIAIGQSIHHHSPSWNPLPRLVRDLARRPTLSILQSIQPENGGFLEATPLTSFVTMALASAGEAEHAVTKRAVEFLRASVREDGSWPIDTNLATWVTTLSIKALDTQPNILSPEQRLTLREWLLGQQYTDVHPYTHAPPGGWAWTPLPGGVPDADDTPGALLALLRLGVIDGPTERAASAGVRWLLNLQNGDGGIPTFCRGWGALPFDRSSPDLTAHALRAWSSWSPHLRQSDPSLAARLEKAIGRALRFLESQQRPDGSWLPLWFGNEHVEDDENPIYGTTHVVLALRELQERGYARVEKMLASGLEYIHGAQSSEDGGWGGAVGAPSTVEETALAVEALAGTEYIRGVERGSEWLCAAVERESWKRPAPIGFYFAKLWYFESLYPLIWTIGTLGKVVSLESLYARPD